MQLREGIWSPQILKNLTMMGEAGQTVKIDRPKFVFLYKTQHWPALRHQRVFSGSNRWSARSSKAQEPWNPGFTNI